MTGKAKSLLQDLKVFGAILVSTFTLATLAWNIGQWVFSVQMKDQAAREHDLIKSEIGASVQALEVQVSPALKQVESVGRDVKTIKCLMLAPSAKAKQRCGLE